MKNKNNILGLPEEVIFCNKCTMSNQRPSSVIEFKNNQKEKKPTLEISEKGICSACNYQKIKNEEINWEERENELKEICDKYRKDDGSYDCIIPGSGGKDSGMTSHLLKYKYGMNPLTVTWAPHKYTDIGWKNFENWIHVGGFDNILFTPNGLLHRYLTKNAFLNLLHPFQPFIMGQKMIGPLMAKQFNVNLIFYGENQAEYGNKLKDNYKKNYDKSYYSYNSIDEIVIGGKKIKDILGETKFKLGDFKPYIPIEEKNLLNLKLDYQYLGYYIKWDPQESYYYSSQHTGFKANTERTQGTYSKYSGIDDKIDWFHYYTSYIKFGLGRASYDAAQEIRNDKITREEGVNLVKQFDGEFPSIYFKDFLEYIDITEEKFYETIDKYRPSHLWSFETGKWELINKIWES